jgi:hypothetical protein
VNEKIYYVYRHVRLDKNEVFYIGKGTANLKAKSYKAFYNRAFCSSKRGNLWSKIANKTEFIVEIVFQCSDEWLTLSKEIEFIKIYGRKNLKTGTLANLEDGGKTPLNRVVSEETRIKLRKSCWTKGRFGALHPFSKKLYAYKIDGSFHKEYNSMREAEEDLNISDGAICSNLKGKSQFVKGYVFRNTYEGERIKINFKPNYHRDIVVAHDEGSKTISEYLSVSEASRVLGITIYHITKHLIQGSKYKNYVFKYKHPELKEDLPEKITSFLSKEKPRKRGKRICQIDRITNQIVNTWDSAADATRFFSEGKSSNSSCLSLCLTGRIKSAYGFKWKFVDNSINIKYHKVV